MSEWISTKERLPEQSGDYLICCDSGHVYCVPYSAKYKLFNAFDEIDEDSAKKYALDVTHWRLLDLPDEFKERTE